MQIKGNDINKQLNSMPGIDCMLRRAIAATDIPIIIKW